MTHHFFSVINNKHSSVNKLNQDLDRINNWAFQWKMTLTLTQVSKQVIFSRQLQKSTHPTLSFNDNTVTQSVNQKGCFSIIKSISRDT